MVDMREQLRLWHLRQQAELEMTPRERRNKRLREAAAKKRAAHGVKAVEKVIPRAPPVADIGRLQKRGLVLFTLDGHGREWIVTRDDRGRWLASGPSRTVGDGQGGLVTQTARMRNETAKGLRLSIRALGFSLRTWYRPLPDD